MFLAQMEDELNLPGLCSCVASIVLGSRVRAEPVDGGGLCVCVCPLGHRLYSLGSILAYGQIVHPLRT